MNEPRRITLSKGQAQALDEMQQVYAAWFRSKSRSDEPVPDLTYKQLIGLLIFHWQVGEWNEKVKP